jgi:hypothetical protein
MTTTCELLMKDDCALDIIQVSFSLYIHIQSIAYATHCNLIVSHLSLSHKPQHEDNSANYVYLVYILRIIFLSYNLLYTNARKEKRDDTGCNIFSFISLVNDDDDRWYRKQSSFYFLFGALYFFHE